MAFPISGNAEMVQNPDNGHTVFNDQVAVLETMGHAVKEIDVSAGGTITLTKGAPTATDYNAGRKLKFTGNPAGAVTVDLPDGDRARLPVESAISTAQTITIDTVTGSATKPTLVQGEEKILEVDGVEIADKTALGAGRQTVWVPAGAMQPTVTAGCGALTSTELTAGRPNVTHLPFDAATEEHAQFSVAMPKSWDLGALRFRARYSHGGGQTVGLDGVAWGLAAVAVGDGDTIDAAFGTEVVATKDASGADTEHVTAESADVTAAGTPAEGDTVYFEISRVVADAADDLDVDARLNGVEIFYDASALNDA